MLIANRDTEISVLINHKESYWQQLEKNSTALTLLLFYTDHKLQ